MKFKKLAVTCIGVVLVVGTIGCSSKHNPTTPINPDETAKKDNKDNKITYWVAMNGNVAPVVQNYGEIEFYKVLQEKTGLEIEFLHPPVGQEIEQFKLLVASRKNLPDVIQAQWLSEYPGGPEKAIKDGIIIPLNEHMDKAPNYKAAMEIDIETTKQCKTDEGNIYAFQGLNQNDLKTFSGMMIREDWLQELGLEAPETIEEWETVLRAFKNKGVENPLSIRANELYQTNLFNTAYNISNDFYLDDNGKIQYGPIQQEYKEYLITLNNWYNEGLLDPDFASIDTKIIDYNILNGQTGATFGWIGSSMGKWYNSTTEPEFALVAVPNPVLNKGDKGKFLPGYANRISGPAAAITTNAKNVDSIIEMFDFLYSEEGMLLKNFGVEGVTYEMVNGKPKYTELILNNLEGLAVSNAMGKYIQANYGAPGFAEIPEYQEQYYQLDAQKEASLIVNKYVDHAVKYVIPPITATPDESKDLAIIMTEVDTFRYEKFIAFVTGAEPLEKFDAYVDQIKQLGIERAIEIKQSGLKRYNAR